MLLENVTLFAIDTNHPHLAQKAIDKCLKQCQFEDVIFLKPPMVKPFNSIQDYSKFMLFDLHKYIKTDFVLSVHWDGYIINANAWQPEFLNYDYIGAIWPWHPEGLRVGNGGFSLRSKRLLELTASSGFVYKDRNEDDLICHVNRDYLVRNGVRFAPEELARYFSFERELTNIETFGFHGEFHRDKYL